MTKLLLIDDDEKFCESAQALLELLGYQVTTAHSVAGAKEALQRENFNRIFLDLMLPDGSGLHVLDAMPMSQLESIRVTIVTGHPALKGLVKAVNGPQVTYLVKPINLAKLQQVLGNDDPEARASESPFNQHLGLLVGESRCMQELYSTIKRLAAADVNVLITGESGTGKELVAKAIHELSTSSGPFIAADCGAFAREIISSELFGHVKGAVPGAVGEKSGVFEQANNGTLFLDEVTAIPRDLQAMLLRVLEDKRVTRLGSEKATAVSCRIISATNQSAEELVENADLREDLYFRLAAFPVHVPPLRDRLDDVPVLARYFLHQLNQEHGTELELSEDALARLQVYEWPGNVRELRNVIHRAYIMSDHEGTQLTLPKSLFSPYGRKAVSEDGGGIRIEPGRSIGEVEKELIQLTLDALNGDKRKAAKALGVSLKTLYNRLRDYEDATNRDSSVISIS